MHKRRKQNQQTPSQPRRRTYGPTRLAGRLWIIGSVILLFGICDVAVRLYDSLDRGATGIMLTLGYDVECLAAGLAILVGGALLLDYAERKQERGDS